MRLSVSAVALCATAAFSETCVEEYLNTDTISLCIDGASATLTYENFQFGGSTDGAYTITNGDLMVIVRVRVRSGTQESHAPETVSITPPDNLIAWPSQADVQDGERFVFVIMAPAS